MREEGECVLLGRTVVGLKGGVEVVCCVVMPVPVDAFERRGTVSRSPSTVAKGIFDRKQSKSGLILTAARGMTARGAWSEPMRDNASRGIPLRGKASL